MAFSKPQNDYTPYSSFNILKSCTISSRHCTPFTSLHNPSATYSTLLIPLPRYSPLLLHSIMTDVRQASNFGIPGAGGMRPPMYQVSYIHLEFILSQHPTKLSVHGTPETRYCYGSSIRRILGNGPCSIARSRDIAGKFKTPNLGRSL